MRHRRHRPEDLIQRAVIQHLRIRAAPGVVFWHHPAGGLRSPVEAAIMKGLGAMAGVSDLIAVRPSLCQCGATKAEIYALELKTKDGRATAEQVEFIHRINDAGGYGAIAYGLDAALSCLEAWKLLLGKAS